MSEENGLLKNYYSDDRVASSLAEALKKRKKKLSDQEVNPDEEED